MIGSTLLNRYHLEAELGQGGMGVVYRAHDTLLERQVAVKILNQAGLGSEGRARLLREAQAVASLDHPNIVSIYDAGEADGTPFIVMQLLEGKSLAEAGELSFPEMIDMARQVCSALQHAHSHGIIHRDLKPENIVLLDYSPDQMDDSLRVKLMDFGLARSLASRLSFEGAIVGTVYYMAPEQALGQTVDGRADLYALGVILYELAAGRLPFLADDPVAMISQHLYAPVVPPSTYHTGIPPMLDTLILRLMSKNPADRPASPAETASILDAIALTAPESLLVEGERGGLSILDRIARGRLVGRAGELTQLHELWTYVQQGNGHMALISGEPGVGKTRLANEMIVYVQLGHAPALRGGCYEYEAATPYLPFAEALRAWVEGQDASTLSQRLGSAAYELARLVPEIENRIGPLSPSPAVSPNEERLRLFDNVARFLQGLADPAGLLFFLDDLHWADNGTIAMLHYLLRRLRQERVLFLAAYREVELDRARPLSDALVEWNRERLATRLVLNRLSLEATGGLLKALFGLETISDEFNQLIFHETEGNPFFIEEVVKSMIEQGQIYRAGDHWERKEIGDLTVPQSVREAIGRRLNRLDRTCLDVLHTASALGKTFKFSELAAAGDAAEDQLLDALDEATLAQLIRPQGADSFTFTHDKIREVLYEEINPIRRRRLHQRIGDGLCRLYQANLGAHVQELAYHFIESGDLAKGLGYAMQAGEESRSLYAHAEALFYFERALEAAESLNQPETRAEIEGAIGDVWLQSGRYEKALEAYQRALALTPAGARRAALKSKIGSTYVDVGDERGRAWLLEALQELDPQEQSRERAGSLASIGRLHHYRGQPDQALEYLQQAQQIAEPLGDLGLLTMIYAYLAGAYQWTGENETSDDWARRCIHLGESKDYPLAVALGHEFLAENAFNSGYWRAALEHARHDWETGEKIGAQDRVAWAHASLTYGYHGLGELKEALAAVNGGLLLAERNGDTRLAILLRAKRAVILFDLGEDEAGRADQEFVRGEAAKLRQFQIYTWATYAQAQVAINRSAGEQVLQAAEEFIATTGQQRPDWLIPAYLILNRLDELERLPERYLAAPLGRKLTNNRADRWRAYGLRLALAGDLQEAILGLTQSIADYDALESRLDLGRALCDRAAIFERAGQPAAAQADLERALVLFEQSGAAWDMARTRERLKSSR